MPSGPKSIPAARTIPPAPAAYDILPEDYVVGAWFLYRNQFLHESGRIIDTGNEGISHSEGQGYGMLMAVAAVFGFGLGVATTCTYTAASQAVGADARGVAFGYLTSAYLIGLAVSPVLAGLSRKSMIGQLTGRDVGERLPGSLAAALYAFAVLPLQQSHFYTVDTFGSFFALLAFYFAVRVAQGGEHGRRDGGWIGRR